MKIMYLGNRIENVAVIEKIFGREGVTVMSTPTPEHAFFKILRGEIEALFLDVFYLEGDPQEVITNLSSLDVDVAVVLVGKSAVIGCLAEEILRQCFGFIDPAYACNLNRMVIMQLTEKFSMKARLETLKNSSIVDGLTQLYNHAYIQGQLDEEVRLLKANNEPVSLIMLDLDNFKHYNDTNGHPAGDEVLRRTAVLLEKTIRKFDMAGRYGGEEFAIVLPCCALLPALRVAERVRAAIAGYAFNHREKQPLGTVSASLGVATLDHKHITSRPQLLDLADQSLYKAKTNGRNRVWFYRENAFFPYLGPARLKEDHPSAAGTTLDDSATFGLLRDTTG